MKKNYDLSKLKEASRGPLVDKKTAKIQKTVRLDLDIVEWLMKKSNDGGEGYLTLLNAELRSAMERENQISDNPKNALIELEAALVKTANDVSRAQKVLGVLKRTSSARKPKKSGSKSA